MIYIILCLFLAGCSTTATRTDGETLTIRGTGKAVWSDGASIEGTPMIKLPPIKLENEL